MAPTDETKVDSLPIPPNNQFVLKKDYDLGGQTYLIPAGVEFVPQGGVFKNGTLIGNHTRIREGKAVFQNVSIEGDWEVSRISTSLFKDLSYINSLQDVLALSTTGMHNVVVIEEGDYEVAASSFGAALVVCSDTELVIDGHIQLLPNAFRGCYVIQVKDAENVHVHGKGSIEGDRVNHIGDLGEWGHGINIINSRNVFVTDLNVANCWGDCIYIGGGSSNVTVDGCSLSKGRRQGVSITYGRDIFVKNCLITEVQGVRPQFAIDVEPNKGETLDNVVIENVKAVNCYGGFKSWGGADGAHIGSVTIRNCSVKGASADNPVKFVHGDKVIVEDCDFETGDKPGIYADVIDNVTVRRNVIRSTHRSAVHVSRAKTKIVESNYQLK